jgi:lycopene cyclase domain-containing protein
VTIPGYGVGAAVSVVAVVGFELAWARTGIFRTRRYWVTLAIVFAFEVLVDGWLTKLSAPIVRYSTPAFGGVRFPWDIPVEDFGFGFSLVTLALVLWVRGGRAGGGAAGRSRRPGP